MYFHAHVITTRQAYLSIVFEHSEHTIGIYTPKKFQGMFIVQFFFK